MEAVMHEPTNKYYPGAMYGIVPGASCDTRGCGKLVACDRQAEHDRRVAELLAANSVEVERRRFAEDRVRELEGHLALLEQAARNVTAMMV
jgi:hypothetical protein